MKIGILEDNQNLGRLLQLSLEKTGYTVHTSQTVKDFLSFLATSEHVDLIITDFRLSTEQEDGKSGLSGADVIRKVRETFPDLPAIIISAAPMLTLKQATRGLSRVLILQKPTPPSVLISKIRELT